MTLSFEWLLVLGAAGIYLFDSALLLGANELVLIGPDRGWAFALPGARWNWGRRRLYIPAPLAPARPVFRVVWYGAGQRGANDLAEVERAAESLHFLRAITLLLFLLLLIGLPWSLLVARNSTAFLLLLALVYPTILAMLAMVFRRAGALGLARRDFWRLAFDSLACAPLAVNLVRRISLSRSYCGDPLQLAAAACKPAELPALHARLRAHIEQMLEEVDDYSSAHAELLRYRLRLMELPA